MMCRVFREAACVQCPVGRLCRQYAVAVVTSSHDPVAGFEVMLEETAARALDCTDSTMTGYCHRFAQALTAECLCSVRSAQYAPEDVAAAVRGRRLEAAGGGGGNNEVPEGSGMGGSAITGASGVRSAGRRLQSKLRPEAAALQVRRDVNPKVRPQT